MTLSLYQSVSTYRTNVNGVAYLYDIVVDAQSVISVRNIRGPRGLITDSVTSLPQVVADDIQEAINLVKLKSSETQVTSGSVSFAGTTSEDVTLPAGLLNNSSYRVYYDNTSGVQCRTEDQTASGFTIVAASEIGTVAIPQDVNYAVYVSTASSSAFGGTATFTVADGGSKTITFPSALSTKSYRVILQPSDFFPVRVSSKSKTGFTIVLGISLSGIQTVTVGYDVVV